MKLIVGLGNPGEKYKNTRHNTGFFVLDHLSLAPGEFVLAKPGTFMNESGEAVRELVQKHKISPENLLVIHDDLDIPLGAYKLQLAKGPKLHNGIASIEQNLGTKDFWRLRVGVENRNKNQEAAVKGEKYVLSRFNKEELEILGRITTQKLIPEVNRWVTGPRP